MNYTLWKGWRPWLVDQQVAGYTVQYRGGNFSFATVKGAGHMIPSTRPSQALAMISAFFNGTALA